MITWVVIVTLAVQLMANVPVVETSGRRVHCSIQVVSIPV